MSSGSIYLIKFSLCVKTHYLRRKLSCNRIAKKSSDGVHDRLVSCTAT
jgi:hypothetical protein